MIERPRFRIFRWILLMSNTVSLISCLIVLIGGKKLVDWFKEAPKNRDDSFLDMMYRIFSAIEVVIVVIGLFGAYKRNLIAFAVHAVLLIVYFIVIIFVASALVIWFWVLAVLLVSLTLLFLYLLYEYRSENRRTVL